MIITIVICLHLMAFPEATSATTAQPSNQTDSQVGLNPWPAWSSALGSYADSIAWGDVDGDGDLDLAVGNAADNPSWIYLNVGGMLQTTPAWSSTAGGDVAWGDMNGDGDLDLAVGNRVYLNVGGTLQTTPTWSSDLNENLYGVAWGDMDGDGRFDLAIGNRVYLNIDGMLQTTPASVVSI